LNVINTVKKVSSCCAKEKELKKERGAANVEKKSQSCVTLRLRRRARYILIFQQNVRIAYNNKLMVSKRLRGPI
jgi:hypothetical protein